MTRINFDHHSATPVLPEVFEAMRPYLLDHYGNPSSPHQEGLLAREAVERARKQVAELVNAEAPENILFTSGGTEAINLAVKGAAYAAQRRGNHIVASAIEHPAVMQSLEFLQQRGFLTTLVAVDREGRVDPGEVERVLTDQTILVCVNHVNHEVGTIEPVEEISRGLAERGIPLFVDATASGGWLPMDVQAMGADLVALSPHRFYGPKGVGVLYRHRRARLTSLLHGGHQEAGRRAGTENVPGIVGAGQAAEVARRDLSRRMSHTARLQARLWEGVRSAVPEVHLNGPPLGPVRISTNLNFSALGVEGEAQVLRCDLKGIAVASGSACLGKAIEASPVLMALGLDHAHARSSLRITLGQENTDGEVDRFIRTFAEVIEHLRQVFVG
jgi:cysteine desulfurase